jgi:hypothetical protein
MKTRLQKDLHSSVAALRFFLITASLCLIASTSRADENNIYRVGASLGWVNYLEPGYISFYGFMLGGHGLAEIKTPSVFDFRFEGDAYYGIIQYDGAVEDQFKNVTPLKAGANDYIIVARAKPELALLGRSESNIFLNAGFGYRYLNDRVNSTSGYQREVAYLFFPVGTRTEFRLNDRVSLGADLEYDFLWYGKVKSHLSDANASNPDAINTQNSGYGFRALLEFKMLTHLGSLSVKPYYQWWSIDLSDRAPYVNNQVLIEPKNSSSMGGVIFEIGI